MSHPSPLLRRAGWSCIVIAIMIAVPVCAHQLASGIRTQTSTENSLAPDAEPFIYPVNINSVAPPLGVRTEVTDYHGQTAVVECRTCHSVRPANIDNRLTTDLNEFHQGLKLQHGQVACVACHNPGDGYSSLRLADGKSVSYADTMKLCAQCHGTQFRDYQHGAHGGMTGYWDLRRGPRQRNHCINCHDPHAPHFATVKPADKPRDRFSPATRDVSHE